MALSERLSEYVRAAFPGIWVLSQEHDEAVQEIAELCRRNGWTLACWDIDRGIAVKGRTDQAGPVTTAADPLSAVKWGLKFTDEALAEVARRAMALGTGARGLRAVLEETLLDLQFRLPDRPQGETIVITGAYVRGRGETPLRPPLRKRMSDIIADKLKRDGEPPGRRCRTVSGRERSRSIGP